MHTRLLYLLLAALCPWLSAAQELAVSLASAGGGGLELNLSRPLTLDDGRLAILLGDVDATALFLPTPTSRSLREAPASVPAGEIAVRVYLVSLAGDWREVASFSALIRDAAPMPEALPEATAMDTPQPRSITWQPSVTLGYKSQRYHRFFPADTAPPRPTFDDGTLQATLGSSWTRNGATLASNWSIAGATTATETLRFGERGNQAPHVDLGSYLVDFQWKGATMQLGHVQAGASRHLLDNFSSRGVRVAFPFGARADFALAQINGTQIVGWNNFFGLNSAKHQIGSATVGLELVPRKGGLRLEVAALHGSLLPLTGFTQGALTDAESSVGGSLRLQASDPSQRLRLDGAFTRSSFTNPTDPNLLPFDDAGNAVEVIGVRRETRGAYYIDAAADVVKNAFSQGRFATTLTLNYRGERVDPQFRSVGAQPQADRFQNQWEVAASAGAITATASYLRSNDNLFGLAALMRTNTRQTAGNVAIPLSALAAQPSRFTRFLPQLSYTFLDMRQKGTGNPLGFDSASQLPDQVNVNHDANLEWTAGLWRVGYRFNRNEQDNRQPGRERADLINTVNTATLGWSGARLNLGFECGLEDVFSAETNQTNRTIRVATSDTLTIRQGLTLLVNLSLTRLTQLGTISATRALEGDAQLTWDLARESGAWSRARPQMILRYANRYQSIFDGIFLLDAITRAQTLQLGITLTLQ